MKFKNALSALTLSSVVLFSGCSNTGNSFDDTLSSLTESASLLLGTKSPEADKSNSADQLVDKTPEYTFDLTKTAKPLKKVIEDAELTGSNNFDARVIQLTAIVKSVEISAANSLSGNIPVVYFENNKNAHGYDLIAYSDYTRKAVKWKKGDKVTFKAYGTVYNGFDGKAMSLSSDLIVRR